jgi:hypothetical protein
MSVKLQYTKPTWKEAVKVATKMRKADREEVMASNKHSPIEAIEKGLDKSHFSACVVLNGTPCAIFGLIKVSPLLEKGVPWFLGTDELFKVPKMMVKEGRKTVEEMLLHCSYLENYVHCKNTKSIKWLRMLGFELEKPQVYGVMSEQFMKFHRSA